MSSRSARRWATAFPNSTTPPHSDQVHQNPSSAPTPAERQPPDLKSVKHPAAVRKGDATVYGIAASRRG
jgi:hypothetical protein